MNKLSIRVKLITWDEPFFQFWPLVPFFTLHFAVYKNGLYISVTEEIRTEISIKH